MVGAVLERECGTHCTRELLLSTIVELRSVVGGESPATVGAGAKQGPCRRHPYRYSHLARVRRRQTGSRSMYGTTEVRDRQRRRVMVCYSPIDMVCIRSCTWPSSAVCCGQMPLPVTTRSTSMDASGKLRAWPLCDARSMTCMCAGRQPG
jgi:hypothetical protein